MSEQEEAVYTEAEADPPEPEPEPDTPDEDGPAGDDVLVDYDDADPEGLPPPEPPAETPPSASMTPEQFERAAKKVSQAFTRYTKIVTEQFEEVANDLTPCPLCPELHPGFVNVADAGRLPSEVAEVVKLFLGMQQEADYRESPETRACDGCDGFGKVRSGSRVANYELLTCPRCTGTGFYPPPSGATHVPVTVERNGQGDIIETFRAEQTDTDPWGSPRLLANGTENPNYGRMPQFKDANLP